jgi:FkbM family methyltransferase
VAEFLRTSSTIIIRLTDGSCDNGHLDFANSAYTIPAVAAGLVVLAAGALIVLVRARRAVLALHRELHTIRELQHDARDRITDIQHRMETVSSQVKEIVPEIQETAHAIATLARTPPRMLPIDSRLTESASEEELTRLAESIAILRPLVPYPRWRTDADLNNPDLTFQLRRWLWQHFNDRKQDAPVIIPWHGSTRLRLFLGNDISGQIYIAGCMEPNEFAFLDRILQPGMTFLDVGANDGIYAVFAASRVGPEGTVWAFEPSAREVARLQFNLDLNHLSVRVFPIALAEVSGQANLTVAGYEHEAHNTLGAFAYRGIEASGTETVVVRQLDAVLQDNPLQRIDVMKLDVEGAELRMLRGAISTLEHYRPYILFEVSEKSLHHQNSTREELLTFLQSRGFRLYSFDPLTGLPMAASPGVYSDNMLAVPAEKPLPAAANWPWPVPAQGTPAPY